jgi:hypothetical protein
MDAAGVAGPCGEKWEEVSAWAWYLVLSALNLVLGALNFVLELRGLFVTKIQRLRTVVH